MFQTNETSGLYFCSIYSEKKSRKNLFGKISFRNITKAPGAGS